MSACRRGGLEDGVEEGTGAERMAVGESRSKSESEEIYIYFGKLGDVEAAAQFTSRSVKKHKKKRGENNEILTQCKCRKTLQGHSFHIFLPLFWYPAGNVKGRRF